MICSYIYKGVVEYEVQRKIKEDDTLSNIVSFDESSLLRS